MSIAELNNRRLEQRSRENRTYVYETIDKLTKMWYNNETKGSVMRRGVSL